MRALCTALIIPLLFLPLLRAQFPEPSERRPVALALPLCLLLGGLILCLSFSFITDLRRHWQRLNPAAVRTYGDAADLMDTAVNRAYFTTLKLMNRACDRCGVVMPVPINFNQRHSLCSARDNAVLRCHCVVANQASGVSLVGFEFDHCGFSFVVCCDGFNIHKPIRRVGN